MRRLILVLAVALSGAAIVLPGAATADPDNSQSSAYDVYCSKLGWVEASGVFFPSDSPSAGATSSFHITGTNQNLIVFTPGTDKTASAQNSYCFFFWKAGAPQPPDRLYFEAWALIPPDITGPVVDRIDDVLASAVGDRVDVLLGKPPLLTAGSPFHVVHGWGGPSPSQGDVAGNWEFELQIDGVVRRAERIFVYPIGDRLIRLFLHNFPQGMTGTHTFVGRWLAPCREAVERGWVPGPCDRPNEKVAAITRSVTVTFYTALWNPGQEWLGAPNQANPSPDGFGNASVWSYLSSDSLVHDPARYGLLPNFARVGNQERWDYLGFINLFVGHVDQTTAMVMHSYGGRVVGETYGRSSILAWASPVSGSIRIRGSVSLPDLSICDVGSGMGSIWSIDKGPASLESTVLPGGGTRSFDLSTTIEEGERLYFIHDPGLDSRCDSLVLNLEIAA